MFKKGSKLYSVFNNKCPRCHEGDFLVEKNPLKLNKAFKMHEKCSHCGFKYMMEPSFFYGAMYISYGLTVAISIAIFILFKVIFGLALLTSFIAIVTGLILLSPFTLRLSRIIWINIFVHYDKAFNQIEK